ncbi:MAG: 3-hydroxyacyl-CoA dehydrogenase NAD-binding domain-containing protein, partial [Caldimonas sp.]
MRTMRYALDADGIATITFDATGSPVNTMTSEWQQDLAETAGRLEQDKDRIRGVLLASAKSTFFAGAELNGVLLLKAQDAREGFGRIEAMKKSFRRIETLGRPVVALLEGAALGGGWEVALVAHARFALDDPQIRFGTPEVSLGLIPGATGIVKTVRLLGLMAAQPYLLEGKLFDPREAMRIGLVDGLGDTADSLRARALAWISAHPDAMQPWDRKDYRMPGGSPATPKIASSLAVAPAMLAQKTRGLYPAQQAVLETMVEGAMVDYDTATRIESRKLARLMVSQTTKNMVTAFFFNLNAIRSGKSRPGGFPRWKPAKVGILGAGMMGSGIAHANASRGIACVLTDVSAEKAEAGRAAIERIVGNQVSQGRVSEADGAAMLLRVKPTENVADLDGCDLIIEAVFERRDLKAAVTRESEPMLAPGGIFASNTSTLPITGLSDASTAPDRFIGLHFFSPVHKMKLVEIIKGRFTSDETVARAFDYVLALGKTPIIVNDSRGFFTSRVFGTFVM